MRDCRCSSGLEASGCFRVGQVGRGLLGVVSSSSSPSGLGGRMRHAVLGAGGVGGLLAAALSRSGYEVVALMREPTLSRYPGRFEVGARCSAPSPQTFLPPRSLIVTWTWCG